MKKIWRAIVPRIVPELIILFTRMIPIAFVVCWIFVLGTDASYQIRSEFKVLLYAFLLSLGGIYLLRITSYVIWRVLTGIQRVIPDIYIEEDTNNNKAA